MINNRKVNYMKLKRLAAVSLAFAMALSAVACGKTDDNEVVETTEEEAVAGEALVDPAYIHPGSLNDPNQVEDTSDYWYPEGDTNSDDYFFFIQTSHKNGNIGMNLQYYKNVDGHDPFYDAGLDGEDGHAKTQTKIDLGYDIEPFDMDITFQDNFTCYDNIRKSLCSTGGS